MSGRQPMADRGSGLAYHRWADCALLFGACLIVLPCVRADDALPIRRVVIEPSRLPAEIRQPQALITVSRKQFEDIVKQANRAAGVQTRPPRLLEARYRATLQDGELVGAAEWKLIQPQGPRAVWSLETWNLAMRGQPTMDGKPAIIGDFEPRIGLQAPQVS